MKMIKGFFSRVFEMNDLLKFLWKAKMWFLIPIIVVLIVLGLLIFFVQATGVAPFIYSLI